MSNYNPFKSAFAQLSTPEAIAWYKSTTRSVLTEVFFCFAEGLVTLIAGTVRAGQVAREFLAVLRQTIIEANQKPQSALAGYAPIALLPAQVPHHPDWDRFIRRQVKVAMVESHQWSWAIEGNRILVTPAPKKRRGGRRKAVVA